MRLRNSESLIPEVVTLPPEKNLHDRMNNCHVIGSKFLGLIRKGSNLLTWQMGPPHVGLLTAKELIRQAETGEWPEDPENLIPRLTRFSPYQARDADCKYTIACHKHDNSVWKRIDTLALNLEDPRNRSLLGYRSAVFPLAWVKGGEDMGWQRLNEQRPH